MKRHLALVVLTLAAVISVMGQSKKNALSPPVRENPLESPYRLLVGVQPAGKITLNGKELNDLQQLREVLQKSLAERPFFQREVIYQAVPEAKFGELVTVLDVISGSRGLPIIPTIERSDDYMAVELVKFPGQYKGLTVNLPLVDSSVSEPSYRRDAVIISIAKTGLYEFRGASISSSNDQDKQALVSEISKAIKNLRSTSPSVLYLNCDQDAFYSDIEPLIKIAQPWLGLVAFWVKKNDEPFTLMGMIRARSSAKAPRQKKKSSKE